MPRRLQLSLMKSIQVFAVVAFCLVAFAIVQADPITVTGTAVSVNGAIFGPSIGFNLTGQNFSASVQDDGGIDRFMHFGFWPCTRQAGSVTPCTTANAGYSSQSDLRGTFTFNGQNFQASVINSLNFQLTSPAFVIPPEFLDDDAVLITAPFSFLGSALIAQTGEKIDLEGVGTVRLLLTRQTVGDITGLFFQRADYTFGPTVDGVTVESVPEPATLVLLFSGLAGVAARVRHRSRRRG
ncbi:MAG TPA: PEP-CTERM sorting domain-containing protein [Pyrinomonadaceae bacterium]|nr:PEP-CTERM sorting domain-containing protein [Pyrinomonadaceae bacterium]